MLKISENQLSEAVKHYNSLVNKFDKISFSDSLEAFNLLLNEMSGAGRILKLLGVDIEGLNKRNHCPLCGHYLGRRDPDDTCDPECAMCMWQGKI